MKKLLHLSLLIFSITSHAQWTDNGTDITTTDKVGIGMSSSPSFTLHVNGTMGLHTGEERLYWGSKHSGTNDHRNYLAPRSIDNTTWDWGNEFGFHSYHRAWYFDGNVGIGTTNPDRKLDILAGAASGGEGLVRLRVSDATSDYLAFFNGTGGSNQFIPTIRGYHDTDPRVSLILSGSTSSSNDNSGNSNALVVFDARRSNGSIVNRPLFKWNSYTDTKMTMLANGNVGIGTTNPTNKLEIGNSFSFHDGGHEIIGIGWAVGGGETDLNPSGHAAEIRMDPIAGNLRFGVSSSVSSSPSTNIMTINNTGKVAIGTMDFSGNHKLRVEGSIGAREIKVEATGWSDFVFANDYQLPSLDEVEKFIAQNNHLPEIPSEAEVLEEGINLGEMNAKLLQKIEELTLYLIEQNKEIKSLRSELDELKKQE